MPYWPATFSADGQWLRGWRAAAHMIRAGLLSRATAEWEISNEIAKEIGPMNDYWHGFVDGCLDAVGC